MEGNDFMFQISFIFPENDLLIPVYFIGSAFNDDDNETGDKIVKSSLIQLLISR